MSVDRTEYIRGLRQLAEFLEQNEDCPIPFDGRAMPLGYYCLSDKEIGALLRSIPVKVEQSSNGNKSSFSWKFAGLSMSIHTVNNVAKEPLLSVV